MIRSLAIAGYRSIRDLRVELAPVNVFVGANGSGKTNLYNALRLPARASHGGLARALGEEGGMPSLLWAGGDRRRTTRGKPPVRVKVSVVLDELSYALELGLPIPSLSMFQLDPDLKEERIWVGEKPRPSTTLLERLAQSCSVTDDAGERVHYPLSLSSSESVLSQLVEPHRYPEVSKLREIFAQWRFYHHFRTDAAAALRQPQIGVRTTALSDSGDDLAAALQTIVEIGDAEGMHAAIANALHGAQLDVRAQDGWFDIALSMPGIKRPLGARELSDGTLRFLCLLAALLSPRPPVLLAFNEPETSLHEDLLEPLAQLFARAAKSSQLLITTHSLRLAGLVGELTGAQPTLLELHDGETRIGGERAWYDAY